MNDVALAGAGRAPSRIDRITAALAPATRESYRNGWRKWEAFAREHGATTFPATPEALDAFLGRRISPVAPPRRSATWMPPPPRTSR